MDRTRVQTRALRICITIPPYDWFVSNWSNLVKLYYDMLAKVISFVIWFGYNHDNNEFDSWLKITS